MIHARERKTTKKLEYIEDLKDLRKIIIFNCFVAYTESKLDIKTFFPTFTKWFKL